MRKIKNIETKIRLSKAEKQRRRERFRRELKNTWKRNWKKLLIILLAAAVVYTGIYLFLKYQHSINDAEAAEIMGELIPVSEEVNRIVWGDGLEIAADAEPLMNTVSGAQYRPVSDKEPYTTVKQLQELVLSVYSERYYESVIKYAFEDTSFTTTDAEGNDKVNTAYARYIEHDGKLKADATRESLLSADTKYDPTTADVTKVDFNFITVEMDATVNGEKQKLDLRLKYQDGQWRLDDPSY